MGFYSGASVGLLFLMLTGCTGSGAQRPGSGADRGQTVIYRDGWGIPHIYASSLADGCYAVGWAQAEDRPQELLKNLLRGMGESSRVLGVEAFQSDLMAQLWDNYGVARRRLREVGSEVRACLRSYVKGMNDYYSEHPSDVPLWWGDRDVDEAMVIAFARYFLNSWSIDDGLADLRRAGIEPGLPSPARGSNQFAVSPARSAEAVPILAIDPHLSWWGPSRFWEFRIHAGPLRGSGVTLAGFPVIGLGHNEDVAWAMTTGGPDTADIYRLTLNPDNPLEYRYAGEWKRLTSRKARIQVAGEQAPREISIYSSHYGPVVAMARGQAYACRMAYAQEVGMIDAWLLLNLARDYQEALQALDQIQLFPQNVMVADTAGNIYYQRTGRVPRRPPGHDWSRPLDGSTPETDWRGFHPARDLVQILNPPQGYMQNCNTPPDTMMIDSPLRASDYPAYLFSDLHYGARGGWSNPRGARALQLLSQDDSVSASEATAYILDVKPFGVERWLGLLTEADREWGMSSGLSPYYQPALADLKRWEGELRRDSSAALKYYYWRQQLLDDLGPERMQQLSGRVDDYLQFSSPLPELAEEEAVALLRALAAAVTRMGAEQRSPSSVFGDIFRVGRDDRSWPVGGGGDRRLGLSTLRSIRFSEPRPDGTRWGRSGQTSTQVVVLARPIRSWSALPIGQSDRPQSAHYRDQAEKLFSPRRLKPTRWQPGELQGHWVSRTVLNPALEP